MIVQTQKNGSLDAKKMIVQTQRKWQLRHTKKDSLDTKKKVAQTQSK